MKKNIILAYIGYCAVVIPTSLRWFSGKGEITDWRAWFIVPAFLPIGLLGVLFGTHHFVKPQHRWGIAVEVNESHRVIP